MLGSFYLAYFTDLPNLTKPQQSAGLLSIGMNMYLPILSLSTMYFIHFTDRPFIFAPQFGQKCVLP